MVGVFCRGVCVRENLVIRIMCHQANDHSGWALELNATASDNWIIALDPHTAVSYAQDDTRRHSISCPNAHYVTNTRMDGPVIAQ